MNRISKDVWNVTDIALELSVIASDRLVSPNEFLFNRIHTEQTGLVYILIGTYSNRGQINMIFANYAAMLEQPQRGGGVDLNTKPNLKGKKLNWKQNHFLSKIQMRVKQMLVNLVGMVSFGDIFWADVRRNTKLVLPTSILCHHGATCIPCTLIVCNIDFRIY